MSEDRQAREARESIHTPNTHQDDVVDWRDVGRSAPSWEDATTASLAAPGLHSPSQPLHGMLATGSYRLFMRIMPRALAMTIASDWDALSRRFFSSETKTLKRRKQIQTIDLSKLVSPKLRHAFFKDFWSTASTAQRDHSHQVSAWQLCLNHEKSLLVLFLPKTSNLAPWTVIDSHFHKDIHPERSPLQVAGKLWVGNRLFMPSGCLHQQLEKNWVKALNDYCLSHRLSRKWTLTTLVHQALKQFLEHQKPQLGLLLTEGERTTTGLFWGENHWNDLQPSGTLADVIAKLSQDAKGVSLRPQTPSPAAWIHLKIIQNEEDHGSKEWEFNSQFHLDPYPLTLVIEATSESLSFNWACNPSWSHTAWLPSLADSLNDLIRQVVKEPETALSSHAPFRAKPFRPTNVSACHSGNLEVTLLSLFHNQAIQQPDSTIVQSTEGSLTYQRLQQRAESIASWLIQAGIQPEDPVALLLKPQADFIAALLGVMLAGGTVLPLDLQHPVARITHLVREVQPRFGICKGFYPLEKSQGGIKYLNLSHPLPCNTAYKPNWETHPKQLAYLMYTSGSTGIPKAVMATHQNLVSRLRQIWRLWPYGNHDIAVLKKSPSLIGFLPEVFAPLLSGTPIHIAPSEMSHDPGLLIHFLESRRITRIWGSPSFLKALHEAVADRPSPLRHAKLLISSGEMISEPLAHAWLKLTPQAKLFNVYGSTELASDISLAEINQSSLEDPGIGRPFPRSQFYLVNPDGFRLPLGVPGKLFVGGCQLARGYWESPKATALAFRPNPFSKTPGKRIFETGDLAYLSVWGNTHLLGRSDHLLNLRGYRIAPSEIEKAITWLPGIRAAGVALLQTPPYPKLVAFLEKSPDSPFDLKTMRAHLQHWLPQHMIPNHFQCLRALPKTRSGKLDRNALAALKLEQNQPESSTSTRNSFEKTLAHIWRMVLNLEQVGIHDHFFELGGHSLLATTILTEIRKHFGLQLPLVFFFKYQTIASQAAFLKNWNGSQSPQNPLPKVASPLTGSLTPEQKGIWLQHQLSPTTHQLHLNKAWAFKNVSIAHIVKALLLLQRQHDSLRMTFQEGEVDPHFKVLPIATPCLKIVDLTSLSHEKWPHVLPKSDEKPFDLKQPPWRTTVFLFPHGKTVIWCCFHHIIVDGWSLQRFQQELRTLLQAGNDPQEGLLPTPLYTFATYAKWRSDRSQGHHIQDLKAFWAEQLKDLPGLTLFKDRANEDLLDFRGQEWRLKLPAGLHQKLYSFCQVQKVSPFHPCLAIFASLLARRAGQNHLALLTPFANRIDKSLEQTIGMFVQTLILCLKVQPNRSFAALVQQSENVLHDAIGHHGLAFADMLRSAGHQTSIAGHPSLKTMFAYYPKATHQGQMAPSHERFSDLDPTYTTSQFDLTLCVEQKNASLELRFQFRTAVFDGATISQLGHQFLTLLTQCLEKPHHSIKDHPGVPTQELQRWYEPKSFNFSPRQPIHRSIWVASQTWSHKAAFVFQNHTLTYSMLVASAWDLSSRMTKAGVKPGDFVAIFSSKSLELPIAWLACMFGGFIGTPIDPEWPANRMKQMIKKLGLTLGLPTGHHNLDHVPALTWLPVNILASLAEEKPPPEFHSEWPAYAMATSGSTGVPKTVVIPHASLANRFAWMDRAFSINPPPRVLQTTPPLFDSCIWEMFWPLTHGGTSILVPDQDCLSGEAMSRLIQNHQVTMVDSVPSVFSQILGDLEVSQQQRFKSLQTLILGSEQFPFPLTERIAKAFPLTKQWNLYGPTEATIGCIAHKLDGRESVRIPIGKAIDGAEALVLDSQLQPVPVGMPGHLFLAGRCLGTGYANQPRETAAVFKPHPHSLSPGARLYQTGDIARRNGQGDLVFCGRQDHQIKLHGIRIESGEIEAHLLRHESVEACVVTTYVLANDQQRLAAYVLSKKRVDLSETELQTYLSDHLPKSHLPSRIIFLEHLPKNAAGKLDRKQLPNPIQLSPNISLSPPRNRHEAILVQSFEQVLGIKPVGIFQSFFDLGGQSLTAMRLMTRLRSTYAWHLPLRVIFEKPSPALLAKALDTYEQKTTLKPSIPNRRKALPLSFSQNRFWFLHQLEPQAKQYHVRLVKSLGAVAVQGLEFAIQAIQDRHEILRAGIETDEGRPHWKLHPPRNESLRIIDLSGLDEPHQSATADMLSREETSRGFHLQRPPLYRHLLLRLNHERHAIIFTSHHILVDGWSMSLWEQELVSHYRHFLALPTKELPTLDLQFVDIAHWQHQQANHLNQSGLINPWIAKLRKVKPLQLIPSDPQRIAGKKGSAFEATATLSNSQLDALRTGAHQNQTTPFIWILSVFKTLLHRFSQQELICVGTPIAGRSISQAEHLLGCFINTLPLATDVGGNPSFTQVLTAVRQTFLDALTFQDMPFEHLIDKLGLERQLDHHPLFQALFVWEQEDPTFSIEPGLFRKDSFSWSSLPPQTKYDLTCHAVHSEKGLEVAFRFCQSKYPKQLATTFAEQFLTFTEQVLAKNTTKIHALSLKSAKIQPNAKIQPIPKPQFKTIPTYLAEIALKQPQAIALEQADQKLTYAALNRSATHLAIRLQQYGFKPETVIAFSMPRSPLSIVVMLGILRAGYSFLAIDPLYPKKRKHFILADCQAKLLLQDAATPNTLNIQGIPQLSLSLQALIPEPSSQLDEILFEDQLAYMIYTSGSTGQPKGIAVSHKAIVTYIHTVNQRYQLHTSDRVLQLASSSFDASYRDIFGALLAGAHLVLPFEEEAKDFYALCQYLSHQRISVVYSGVPIFLRLLAKEAAQHNFTYGNLRLMISGAESLFWRDIHLLHQSFGSHVAFFNQYGLSETCITTTSMHAQEPRSDDDIVPLGLPLPYAQTYLLSAKLVTIPQHAAGQIFIGGPAHARCYLGKPRLTARRFIPDPFSKVPGARLFDTGDLAVFCDRDMNGLRFLGRKDRQVKIRGQRVELNEIEACLQGHQDVALCAIRYFEHPKQQLVAYLKVITQLSPPTIWREFLATKLPQAMIPDHFMILEKFPRLPSNKIDYGSLPQPSPIKRLSKPLVVSDQITTMTLLAQIWSQVLGGHDYQADDHFFHSGGHSLLAAQVVARIRQWFGLDMPLRTVFENQYLGDLAKAIDQLREVGRSQKHPPIEVMPSHAVPVLSSAQNRLWFLEELEPGRSRFHIPVAYKVMGPTTDQLLSAILTLPKAHPVLRTALQVKDGKPQPQLLPIEYFQAPLIDLSHLPSFLQHTVRKGLAAKEAKRVFRLRGGPLYRHKIVKLAENQHMVLQTYHHMIADGWSLQIIEKHLLQELSSKQPSSLSHTDKPQISYFDWAYEQQKQLQGPRFSKSLAFWQQAVQDTSALEMHQLRNLHQATRGKGDRFGFNIPAPTIERLKAMSHQQGCTLFMGLQAAFEILLHRYSGQHDFCIGVPFANRGGTQTEALVGLFVNTLPLRTQVMGNPTIQEFMIRIRNHSLDAFAHSDIPFEDLVQALGIARNLSRTPLFQVSLVYHNQPSLGPRTPAGSEHFELVRLEHRPTTAKYDLSAHFEPLNRGLRANFIYDLDRFSDDTIRQMAEHFLSILNQIGGAHHLRLSQIQLARSTDKLIQQNDYATGTSAAELTPLHQVFYQAQATSPDALAICHGTHLWSYQHLAKMTAAYVNAFRQQQLRPGDRVALLAERSPHVVAACLACLHTGLTLVPLSPAWPVQRLQTVIEDAKLHLLLHDHCQQVETLHTALTDSTPPTMVLLGDDPTTLPEGLGPPQKLPDLLPVYLLYTSGSTGAPKGVLGTYRALSHRLHSLWQSHPFSQNDVCLLKKDPIFIGFFTELLGPLGKGRPLIIAPEGDQRSPQAILKLVVQHRISRLWTFPSLLAGMLPNMPRMMPSLRCLKLIFASGEPLSSSLAKQILQPLTGTSLVNIYGATEIASDVALQPLTVPPKTPPSIGLPMQGVQLWVQTLGGALQPPELPGQLVVSGTYLAQGYWRQPKQTALRFRPNPFGKTPGSRLFHTGDWASYHPDTGFNLYRRIDHILKIRGYRIHPQQIVSRLLEHPVIKEAAVITTHHQEFGELIAFLVVKDNQPRPWRVFLGQTLPAYAIPSRFHLVKTLPRALNGKLLVQDLLKVATKNRASTITHHPPRDEKEALIASIWADVLRVKNVGIRDNFFDLGGHSLLAAQARARMTTALGMDFPLSLLFKHQTIRQLVAHLNAASFSAKPAPLKHQPYLPLLPSYAQERWWFLQQLEGGHHYQLFRVYQLQGVSPNLLEKALQQVVMRHQPLRTLLKEDQGQLRVRTSPWLSQILQRIDLQMLPSTSSPQQFVMAERQRIFQLSKEPGFRAIWLDIGQDQALFMLHFHHLAIDAWGLDRFKDELTVCYESLHQKRKTKLTPLRVNYADYARWQRAQFETNSPHPSTSFWQEKLHDVPPLQLVGRGPRPAQQSHRGDQIDLSFSREFTRELRAFARANDATVYLVLLSAFRGFLQHLSDQNDFCIGTPVANRNHQDLEPLVGAFVNTLSLRIKSSPNPNFHELLHLARAEVLEALDHQAIPFSQVVEAVNPTRDASRHPLFQVMFTYFHTPPGKLSRRSMRKRLFGHPLETPSSTTLFDMNLYLHLDRGRLVGRLSFNVDLFTRETGSAFHRRFSHMLRWAIRTPHQPLAAFPCLKKQAYRDLQRLWGGPPKIPSKPYLNERIQATLTQESDRIAIVDDQIHLSRQFLDQQATQLAATLQDLGVAPEVPVAVFMTCSANRLISQLAIWRAGGVILPLHPDQPQERIVQRLNQATIPIVLVDSNSALKLPTGGFHTLTLKKGALIEAAGSLSKPKILGQHAAYLLFTSGSTGKPKLTINHHAGILNRVLVTDWYAQTDAETVVARKTSFEFDVAMWEWAWALVNGFRLELTGEDTQRDPRLLNTFIAKRRITHMHFVPSVLHIFLETARADAIASLHEIFTSGEALSQVLCDQWFQKNGPPIHNLYGPTEAAVDVSHCLIKSSKTSPTLGRPLGGNTMAVLSSQMQPIFPGQLGQIFLGGHQLARGYHQDPRRTAQVFLPHPFSKRSGDRLYASGDVGRFDDLDQIQFHGRRDHQIKLRGIRIELGEIAAALSSKPLVNEAQVVAFGSGTETTLVAYIVLSEKPPGEYEQRLREQLFGELPKYAVPSQIQILEKMPKSKHGKFDPRGLAPPTWVKEPMHGWQLPSHPWLRDLWTAILKQSPTSMDDDFFALGGNSLQVVRLAHGIAEQTGWQIPLFHFFQATTLRKQISLLMDREVNISSAITYNKTEEPGTWIFVHPGDGLVHHYRLLANALGDSGTCIGLPALWTPHEDASLRTIASQLQENLDLQRCRKPLRLIGWSAGGMLAFEFAHHLKKQGIPIDLLTLIDCRRLDIQPERLSTEPLYDFLKQLTGRDVQTLKLALEKWVNPREATQDFIRIAGLLSKVGIDLPQPETMTIHFARRLTLLKACMTYKPQPLDVPVAHIHASGSRHLNAWADFCRGPLVEFESQAEHETLLKDPHVKPLATWLQKVANLSEHLITV